MYVSRIVVIKGLVIVSGIWKWFRFGLQRTPKVWNWMAINNGGVRARRKVSSGKSLRCWGPLQHSIYRSNAGSRIPGGENAALDNYDREKPQLRPHQVHPVIDSHQTIICYEKSPLATITDRPPSPQPQNSCYPLAPNICVEAGRIQFIRQEAEGTPVPVPPPPDPAITVPTTPHSPNAGARITVTRGIQTDEQDEDLEAFRDVQTFLENRIVEVESALETSQRNELRDKQTINKLTKQLNRFQQK